MRIDDDSLSNHKWRRNKEAKQVAESELSGDDLTELLVLRNTFQNTNRTELPDPDLSSFSLLMAAPASIVTVH